MDMRKKILSCGLLLACLITPFASQAQSKTAADKSDIEYELLFDDPYDMNVMWVNFYPFYADMFATNFNVGFGAQVNYLWKNKFDFHAQGRSTYGRFTDFGKLSGDKNNTLKLTETSERSALVRLGGSHYLELGGTYHLKDEAESGESKIVVYTNRYTDRKWASAVPEYIKIPTKVRKIIGIRTGTYYWGAPTNLGHALEQQGLRLVNTGGDTLSNTQLYTNVRSAGFYLGGKIMRIRNAVVKPKKYDVTSNDMVFSAYADILYAPLVQVEDVSFRNRDSETGAFLGAPYAYSTGDVPVRRLGFRLGMEGMFNREFAWTYGAEVGMRPSLQTRGFYANVRVGFSFASKMQQKRQAYQVESKGK